MTQTASKPGSLDTGTINLSTGTVSFPITLASLPGRNGLDFNLSLQYSSMGTREIVDTWTVEAPTGVMGLGWSFPQEKIVRIWNGTTQESTYALLAENTLYALVKGGIDAAAGEIYETTSYQFWKIRYQPEHELWAITKEDGTCYFYGGNVQQTQGQSNTSLGNSIEWGVRWGTWTGPSNVVEKQGQFPVAWNLASIETIWGDRVTLLYEQDQQLVGTTGATRKNYTQACRLSQVIGTTGENILLHYGPEEGAANPYETRVKEHTLPGGGPDAYQDRLERHFLDALEVRNANSEMVSHVQLRYASLGSGEMQKQILKSITCSNSQGHPYEPPRLFAYYGETTDDGVSVSKTDASHVAHGGALFGALKFMTAPQGAITSYQYTELAIPNARRDLDIPRPGNEWQHPLTYLGLDYAVVIWRGTGSKEHLIHVSAYQWVGQWVATTLNELTVGDATDADNIQVEIAPTFFAIITPGQAQAVHLFHQRPYSHGEWRYLPPNTGTLTDCLLASGNDFLAIIDQSNGKLSCLTYNTLTNANNWHVSEEFLKTGKDTKFALAAGKNYICTVSAVPDKAFQPELRLYTLDDYGKWRKPIIHECAHFFPPKHYIPEPAVKRVSLVASAEFVAVLASNDFNAHGPESPYWMNHQLFVYRWTETEMLLETIEKSETTSSDFKSDPNEGHVAVVGDMIVVTGGKKKVVHQYNGERWLSKDFDNDSTRNNYLGSGSFSTTVDGQAQYWEFNPHTSEWGTGNLPTYKDGNPTLWEKFWSAVWPLLSLSVGILTLPFSFGTGLLIDLALLPFDLYSLLMVSGTRGGGGHESERFFTGDNHVYYRDATGTWSQIGELLTEAEKAEQPVSGEGTTFETREIQFQNTQAASTFIAYAITQDRKKILTGGSSVRPAGYPKYISEIQFLKNGAFLASATTLPAGEKLQRSPDDETSLVGWNAFLSFQGGETLHQATSLKLHRVIQDGFQGPLKDDVVSRVSVHDGYEETHTHYDYETASAQCAPTGTALYHKVTTLYSGASTSSTRSNGYTESYFSVGDTASLSNQPADRTSTNSADYPALMAGRLYATSVFDGTGRQVAATTHSWFVVERSLLGRGVGCFLRQVKEESESDGCKKVVENDYSIRDFDGFPGATTVSNYDVTGHKEEIKTWYRYGVDLYPQLKERHILAPVAQATTRVNDIQTAYQATVWLPTPRAAFQLTPGQELPPQFQGTEWSITETNSVSTTVSCPFPLGYASTRWEPEIPALTLISPVSGTLLCTYNCDLHVQNGWAWATLEVLVDGKKVWEATKTATHISEAVPPIELRSNQRVEWRVTNCGMEVDKDEQGHNRDHSSSILVSVRNIHIQGVQSLAPAATYLAKKPLEFFARPEDVLLDWLKTSEVVARNPTYGVVTETRGVDAITSSTIYDTTYQFPVARFVHASVEHHEAGYYGFEDYEKKEGWQLTGTPGRDLSSHSGQKALSGKNVRIEPLAFTPRTAATPYIVSAWVKPRREGSGGQIGFGNTITQIAPNNDDWQYVELMTATPLANQKPFASCDGALDDFRFGPVDAPFNATVYDPTYHFVTEQLGTNGETIRLLYDDLQTLIAMTGVDGKEISHLMAEMHSREREKPFNATRPNQKLSILPGNGGRYYRSLSDVANAGAASQDSHADYIGGPTTYVSQRFTRFSATSYGFKLRVSAPRDRRSQSFFAIVFGGRAVRCDADHTIKLTAVMPKASPGEVFKSFTPDYDPLDGAEWMLMIFGQQAFFFLDGVFLFSEPFDPGQFPFVLLWGPDEAAISGSDVFLFFDPITELQYTDGLDRVIQTVHLDQHEEGTVASQILYDGWGHPAVTTKPLHIPEISLTYQRDLVKTFDWQSGHMTGKIVDYYQQASVQVPDQKAEDALYPYRRQVAEANPLARISEVGGPGVDLKAGSPQSVLMDFGRTAEANALLADLHLTDHVGNYTLLTTRRPFDGHTRVVTTRLFDLQGKLIALRQGTGKTALTSTRHIVYANDGTNTVTSTQPNVYTHPESQKNGQYTTTTVSDFLGHIQAANDSDRSAEQCIYDPAGRLCFKMDAEGANQHPHHILYWRYDALGRILEDGLLRQQWNREQLQRVADAQVSQERSRFTCILKMSEGIGKDKLKSPDDRIFPFDYESSGKLDHLVVYRPGTGEISIVRHTVDQFTPVYASSPEHAGIGGYHLNDPRDQAFAFDYESSGKLDHLVLYRPGEGIIQILKRDGNQFTSMYPQRAPGLGIGGCDLLSPDDRILAFDYQSSGKLDHLVVVSPGTGKLVVLKQSAGQFTSVDAPSSNRPAAAVLSEKWKPYLVLSPNDRVFAFDYQSSGKLDHLVVYAPGTGKITILKQGSTPVYYDQAQTPEQTGPMGLPVRSPIVPMIGIGGYDLKDPRDRMFAFDYERSGKLDHLVAYRPGTGAIFIIKHTAGQFTQVYAQGDPGLGLGGYDLASPADRGFAFDYESSGKLDHLVLYRPGEGIIWFLSTGAWQRQYTYDLAPNNETAHLKGRLYEVRTRDDDMQEVREAFTYNLDGNLISTHLVAEAFDTLTRVTHYEYDRLGHVTRIIYPYDRSDQSSFEVHYFYNANGQLASIGTADDPSRYATYEYDLEGSIKTERLNKQRLQYDHSYDFQGHLLSLQASNGLFSEELRYRDANNMFKDGNLVSAMFTGSALSSPHGYSYQYNEFGRLTSALTVEAKADVIPHPEWDLQKLEYDASGNLLYMQQGHTSSIYQYTPGTNQLKSLLHNSTSQRPFGFETSELEHFHSNSEPLIFGDWYAKGHGGGITTGEKHSGTQSYQLVEKHVLLSKIQVIPESKGYLCSGWVKIQGPNQEVGIQIKTSLNGPVLSEQRVPFTGDRWQSFQCLLADAGSATELFVVILQTQLAHPSLPVYIDDITFVSLEKNVYEHNSNGWITKSGEVDVINYDPHAALPVDVRAGNQHTHLRYGGRGQRVVKTTTTSGQNAPLEQRLYIHGANAYPLIEHTQTGRTCYIYGPGGLLAQSEDAQTFAFFLKDHLGSTRVVVNEENQPIATFQYLPFGSMTPDNSSSQEALHRFRYLFTGQEYDEEIGLHNYRARLYDSNLGRFLTPDPKWQFPSPYVYVNNNPVNFTDPTGEMLLRTLRAPGRFRRASGFSRAFATKNVNGRGVEVFDGTIDKFQALKNFQAFVKDRRFILKEVPILPEEVINAPDALASEMEGLAKVEPLTAERFNQNQALFTLHASPKGMGEGKPYPTRDTLASAFFKDNSNLTGVSGTYRGEKGGAIVMWIDDSVQKSSILLKGDVPGEVQTLNLATEDIAAVITSDVLNTRVVVKNSTPTLVKNPWGVWVHRNHPSVQK